MDAATIVGMLDTRSTRDLKTLGFQSGLPMSVSCSKHDQSVQHDETVQDQAEHDSWHDETVQDQAEHDSWRLLVTAVQMLPCGPP